MSEKWYYVFSGERQGPVEKDEIISLCLNGTLGDEDYVWKKGFENWVKIVDAQEIKSQIMKASEPEPTPVQAPASIGEAFPEPIEDAPVDLAKYSPKEKSFFIKTGSDRGREEIEYGPFSLELLKRLYDENRINGKTYVFCKEMKNWELLGDMNGFEDVFEDAPPVIKDEDRRAFRRKPFIARMFIENENRVFEGICRDISIGGMQVLVDHFPVEVGKRVSINAHPENSEYHFTASGEIVRKLEGGLGFSFRFINLNEEAVQAINSYTAKER